MLKPAEDDFNQTSTLHSGLPDFRSYDTLQGKQLLHNSEATAEMVPFIPLSIYNLGYLEARKARKLTEKCSKRTNRMTALAWQYDQN